jgi:hypothetical protein
MSATRRSRVGTVLLLSNALLLCALENCVGYAPNSESFTMAYGLGLCVWSALTLWGLIHAGSLLYRAAFPVRCPHCHASQEAS